MSSATTPAPDMTTTLRSTALYLFASLSVACGSAATDHPETLSGESGAAVNSPPSVRPAAQLPPAGDDVATGGCELGASRDCRVWLPEVNGIKNCFVGTQVCVSDAWSDCMSDDDATELLSQSQL